ncbi:hypothetical protein [Sanguibacter inulinus]|uniref:Uncharacterized protein n=1 Tax=Sanguibacter inulinus TaxID=60922 RepID=A0A853EXF8_9MICO|nr:hypothetical protein [Sanguibacter inulinus]MBF0724130.1 hypothetical protein [Sanguibacter inulinus]NYS95275.1 hypothetical protein [Sanguibacter inulinus]
MTETGTGDGAATGGPRVSSAGVSLLPPAGWVVVDDVSGSGARAPVASLADASGRHVAAQLSVRRLAPLVSGALSAWGGGPSGGHEPLVSLGTPGGPGSSAAGGAPSAAEVALATAAQSRVTAAFADDPSAVLLDAAGTTVRTVLGLDARAVRLDVVEHDMSTPVVRTSVLVACTDLGGGSRSGRLGVVEVSATVPVAHHRALVHAVEAALATLRVQDEVVPADGASLRGASADPGGLAPDAFTHSEGVSAAWTRELARGESTREGTGAASTRELASAPWTRELDRGRWYVPPEAWLGADELDIFVRGSRRLAPAHRPGPARAGLVDDRGVSTPTGELVRRAVHRPDVRLHVRAADVVDASLDGSASMIVDRVGPWAVVRATPPPVAARRGEAVAAHRYLEVVDLAAAPARVVSWMGTGPGRSSRVSDGLVLALVVHRSGQSWGSPAGESVLVERGASPRATWQRVLAALV